MQQVLASEYILAVKAIKGAIIQSRYRAAKKVNAEVLSLYYAVGRYISTFSRQAKYGTNALKIISDQLQQEMPGLQGFSDTNMKRMRKFYEEWSPIIEKRPPLADDFNVEVIPIESQRITIRPLVADEFTKEEQQDFLATPFSHHYEVLIKAPTLDERMFYIHKCATEFWTKEHLISQLKSDLYHSSAVTNNFLATIDDEKLREKAMRTFKQELVLDFLHIPDPDYVDELDVEDQIVKNIKNFIMAIGTDFPPMGFVDSALLIFDDTLPVWHRGEYPWEVKYNDHSIHVGLHWSYDSPIIRHGFRGRKTIYRPTRVYTITNNDYEWTIDKQR